MKAWVKTLLVSHIITQKSRSKKKMVKVWAARITPLLIKRIMHFIMKSCRNGERKKQTASRVKMQKPRVWERGLFGPGCSNRRSWEKIHPSICPTPGEYVLCAFSDCKEAQVGCDLEMIGEYREKVAKRLFLRGGICTYNRNRQRRGAEGIVLPLLGSEGELYESHPKGDGD